MAKAVDTATAAVWGYVRSGEEVVACHFVQWTRHTSRHLPNVDLLIGTWGDDDVKDKMLVSWDQRNG
jgi:hypothetical protein